MRRFKIVLPMLATLVALVLLGIARPMFAADDEPLGGKLEFRPAPTLPIKPDNGSAERAIAGFHVPKGLTVKLWASEPMLANPSSLSVDEKGRVYVTEANRFNKGVLDVRAMMTWLEEDIACKTVADRVAMVKKHANEAKGKEALDSTDAERIVLLQDTTGSGRANQSTVFTEGYNRTEDGLASGVLAYHGNVYFTCIPNLYMLKDTKGDGKADQRKVLSTGYGVRYAFVGHDLHGLVIGPDGKLYFSVGDRAANAEAVDGSLVQATECGSVFRCNLDGSNLELFATGLRNPEELRFDAYGNLFTGDNNPDKGDPARWVYVVEGGDSGWRIGYQEGKHPRDGGPWTSEQIFQTADHNNANYIVPAVAHAGAGPSGLAYNTGVGLPDKFDGAFFLCDYRGPAPNSGIWAFKVKPNGATFTLTNVDGKPIDRNTRIQDASIFYGSGVVDVDMGPDGSLYVADWTQGWERPMLGRIYRILDESKIDNPLIKQTAKLIADGMEKRPLEELLKLLSFADLRVRQEAQFALAAKGAASVAALVGVAKAEGTLFSRLHALWGLGQIAATAPDAVKDIIPLLADKELEVRCQAAKVLGDAKSEAAYAGLVKLAADPEPRAQYFAAMALGKIGKQDADPALINILKENADKDPALRYGAVWALAKIGDELGLSALAKDPSPSVRLGAVLALRKMESGEVTKFLGDSDRIVVLEAARAINDIPILPALGDLSALASKPVNNAAGFAEKPSGSGPGPFGDVASWILWRVANAGYRLGTPEAAQNLAALAVRTDVPAEVRVEAIRDLTEWTKPGNLDRITNLFRPIADRDPKVAREAAKAIVEKLSKDPSDEVKVAAAKLMQKFGLGEPATLIAAAENMKNPPDVRLAALQTLLEQKHPSAASLLEKLAKDGNGRVRESAIREYSGQPNGVDVLTAILAGKSASVGDTQAAIGGLGDSPDPKADAVLAEWMQKLVSAEPPPTDVRLDLTDAAAKRKDAKVAALLKQYEAMGDVKNPVSEFRDCLTGGNATNGRKTFAENAAVSCIRCHSVRGEGGVVGPQLDDVGARQPRDYLLESVIVPSAKIAPGFESAMIQTKEGKYKTGIVKKDDDKEVVLLDADNKLITIAKSDVKSRDKGPSVMPEGLYKALSKRELRDLVEYLASLKTPPKATSLDHGTPTK